MPTVTSSRSGISAPKVNFTFDYDWTHQRISSGWLDLDPWSQTTTSWRTGRQWMSEDERYENMTGEELRANINREYARAYDTGHDFSTEKTSQTQLNKNVQMRSAAGFQLRYTGPVVVSIDSAYSVYPLSSIKSYAPSTSQKTVDGAKLWSMAVPTATEVSLASFLGELREGLPSIPGKSSFKKPPPNASGEEYLNWKFGIQPLKSDLQNLAKGISDFHKRVEQFKRDSGRNIRRRRHFGETRTEVDVFAGNGNDVMYIPAFQGDGRAMTTNFYDSMGSLKIIDIVEGSVSFSGAYTYYLSEAHDFLGKLERYEQLANHALGLEFDLDTAWELTPWSWLVDWFADVGTFVKNLTALSNDNVVARYAYVMHHQKVTRMFTVTGMRLKLGATGPTSASSFQTYESKTRTGATPYGFGFNMGALSLSQKAILGALGMSKSPGILHKS
jgi:hypothetical protein